MIVKGNTKVEVEITEAEAVNIAINTICRVSDWEPHWRIDKDKVVYEKVFHTSHGWTETITVRDAQPSDYSIYEVINNLRKSLKGL